jgi:hypothetical protein
MTGFSDTGSDPSDFINRKCLDQLSTVQGRLLVAEFIKVFLMHLSVSACQRCAPAQCSRLIEYNVAHSVGLRTDLGSAT